MSKEGSRKWTFSKFLLMLLWWWVRSTPMLRSTPPYQRGPSTPYSLPRRMSQPHWEPPLQPPGCTTIDVSSWLYLRFYSRVEATPVTWPPTSSATSLQLSEGRGTTGRREDKRDKELRDFGKLLVLLYSAPSLPTATNKFYLVCI